MDQPPHYPISLRGWYGLRLTDRGEAETLLDLHGYAPTAVSEICEEKLQI